MVQLAKHCQSVFYIVSLSSACSVEEAAYLRQLCNKLGSFVQSLPRTQAQRLIRRMTCSPLHKGRIFSCENLLVWGDFWRALGQGLYNDSTFAMAWSQAGLVENHCFASVYAANIGISQITRDSRLILWVCTMTYRVSLSHPTPPGPNKIPPGKSD